MVNEVKKLAKLVISGDMRSISRAISSIENNATFSYELLKELFPHTGKAHVIGITGPPGSGKSTIVDQLISLYRGQDKSVGIIAVDPTSPFSGGAFLGDRVRMSNHFLDEGVYIRSMATRGKLGGISKGSYDAVTVLEASGKDIIIVETVGVGQDEIDIINMAHTSAVVLVPGMGDDIQAIKAGILEIGDVFIVNKSDKQGAERVVTELNQMLDMYTEDSPNYWRPPVLKTIAIKGEGIKEVVSKFKAHRDFILNNQSGYEREVVRCRNRIIELWKEAAMDNILPRLLPEPELQKAAVKVATKKQEPYSVIEKMLEQLEIRQ